MRLSDLLFAYPAVQPVVYRLGASAERLLGLMRQRSGAVLPSQAPILLIVGCGRSGNTLLRRGLMERGSIYIPPESYVWASQAYGLLRASALSWSEQVTLMLGKLEYMQEFDTFQVPSLRQFALAAQEWERERRSLGALIHALYFWLAEQHGVSAEWVGDKTPMNLVRIGLISRIFPNARYVYIERDPVEVAVSYRAAGLYSNLEDGARRWKLSREAWLRFRDSLDPAWRVEVRFDELISDRHATYDRVLTTFGIARRPEPIDVTQSLGDVYMREHHRNARTDGDEVRHGAHSALTSGERAALRSILGDLPMRAGYEAV